VQLEKDQKDALKEVLLKHHNVFAWDEETLGRTTLLEHTVPTGDHPPIVQYQYPIPAVAKEAMREQVDDMVRNNIVRDSSSNGLCINSGTKFKLILQRDKTIV
jgi:hypothetical protein